LVLTTSKFLNRFFRKFLSDLQQIADYRLDVLTDMDLEHGVKGLLRIQEIYNLDERDMAKGLLAQKEYKSVTT